jgi:hypothetical protein
MKKLATEVKLGDIIKSPFSPYWGIVINIIDSGGKKIDFEVTYTHPIDMKGMGWTYTFFKTTKVTVK